MSDYYKWTPRHILLDAKNHFMAGTIARDPEDIEFARSMLPKSHAPSFEEFYPSVANKPIFNGYADKHNELASRYNEAIKKENIKELVNVSYEHEALVNEELAKLEPYKEIEAMLERHIKERTNEEKIILEIFEQNGLTDHPIYHEVRAMEERLRYVLYNGPEIVNRAIRERAEQP